MSSQAGKGVSPGASTGLGSPMYGASLVSGKSGTSSGRKSRGKPAASLIAQAMQDAAAITGDVNRTFGASQRRKDRDRKAAPSPGAATAAASDTGSRHRRGRSGGSVFNTTATTASAAEDTDTLLAAQALGHKPRTPQSKQQAVADAKAAARAKGFAGVKARKEAAAAAAAAAADAKDEAQDPHAKQLDPSTKKLGLDSPAAAPGADKLEKQRVHGAGDGLVDLAEAGAMTHGLTKDQVKGTMDEVSSGLNAKEQKILLLKKQRLLEIQAKYAATLEVDPGTTKRNGLLCKLRQGHKLGVSRCEYDDEGEHVLSCGYDGMICVWDVKHQKLKRQYRGHVGIVYDAAFCPAQGNKLLASVGQDTTVRVWDKRAGRVRLILEREHRKPLHALAWANDGKRLATAGEDRNIVVWDIETAMALRDDPAVTNEAIISNKMFGAPENTQGHSAPIRRLLWTKDDGTLLSGADDGFIKFWELGSRGGGVAARSIRAHAGGVLDMDISPDGVRLASASRDGTVKIWFVRSGVCSRTFVGHDGSVYAVRWSKEGNGRRLFTGGHDFTVIMWDSATGAVLHRMSGIHRSYILGLAVRGDGREFATASGDRTIGVWRALAPTKWDEFVDSAKVHTVQGISIVLEAAGMDSLVPKLRLAAGLGTHRG